MRHRIVSFLALGERTDLAWDRRIPVFVQRLEVIVGPPTLHLASLVLVLAMFRPIVRPHETRSGQEFGCLVQFGSIAVFPAELTTHVRITLPLLVKNTRD